MGLGWRQIGWGHWREINKQGFFWGWVFGGGNCSKPHPATGCISSTYVLCASEYSFIIIPNPKFSHTHSSSELWGLRKCWKKKIIARFWTICGCPIIVVFFKIFQFPASSRVRVAETEWRAGGGFVKNFPPKNWETKTLGPLYPISIFQDHKDETKNCTLVPWLTFLL